jgi:hypothetical protein
MSQFQNLIHQTLYDNLGRAPKLSRFGLGVNNETQTLITGVSQIYSRLNNILQFSSISHQSHQTFIHILSFTQNILSG